MGLIKEPKDVDMSTKSEPWTEQELRDFRAIIQATKTRKARQTQPSPPTKTRERPVS